LWRVGATMPLDRSKKPLPLDRGRFTPLTEDEKEMVYDIINGIRGIIY